MIPTVVLIIVIATVIYAGISNQRGAGPSKGCVCGVCPCLLIDNMITTVSPAMACYCQFISYLSDFVLAFARVLAEVVNLTVSTLENHIGQHNSYSIDEHNLSDTVTFREDRLPNREILRNYENTIKETFSSKNKLSEDTSGKKVDEKAVKQSGVSDTVTFGEDRLPNRELLQNYENTIKKTFSSKNKLSEDTSSKKVDEKAVKQSGVSEKTSTAVLQLPPQDQHRVLKSHYKSESLTSSAVKPERKETPKTATKSGIEFEADKPLKKPKCPEVSRTEMKLETGNETSKSLSEPERKEAFKIATRPGTTNEASKPSLKSEIKAKEGKAMKSETLQGERLPLVEFERKESSILEKDNKEALKTLLKQEAKAAVKTESELSGKTEAPNAGPQFSEVGSSSAPNKEKETGNTISRIAGVDSATTQTQSVCKKCIERGKICVGGCPRDRLTDLSTDKSV